MNDCQNSTTNQFNLMAFSTFGNGDLAFFMMIFLMYLITVSGNLTIITLISTVTQLHKPMYFFLCNLSIIDVIYVSALLPKLLSIILIKYHIISFSGCITQLCFFVFSGDAEIFILTSMAYDRYVAVCNPLQYSQVITKRLCMIMASSSWIIGAMNALLHGFLTSMLHFCNSHDIDHFFCDVKTLMLLSSSDTTSNNVIIFVEGALFGSLPFLLTVISYVFIIVAILKIQSPGRRLKVFSSCSSHLITVILFYGPMIFLYLKPESEHSRENDKLISLIYLALVPMLNPFVYTLRNMEVWAALQKLAKLEHNQY